MTYGPVGTLSSSARWQNSPVWEVRSSVRHRKDMSFLLALKGSTGCYSLSGWTIDHFIWQSICK